MREKQIFGDSRGFFGAMRNLAKFSTRFSKKIQASTKFKMDKR